MNVKTPKRGAFDYLLNGNAIHVEPPEPPRHGPPGRIRIEIEIMDHRNKVREARKSRRASWWFVILMILLTIGLAHGEEQQRRPDQNRWSGTSFRFKDSDTTYHDFYGPDGQAQHCTSFRFKDSDTTHTECGP